MYAMVLDSNAMKCDFNDMLRYCVWCQRYAWTDCLQLFEVLIYNLNEAQVYKKK